MYMSALEYSYLKVTDSKRIAGLDCMKTLLGNALADKGVLRSFRAVDCCVVQTAQLRKICNMVKMAMCYKYCVRLLKIFFGDGRKLFVPP